MTLRDRRQILEALEPVGLKATFPFVEPRPIDAASAACVGNVTESLCQLDRREPLASAFLGGILVVI